MDIPNKDTSISLGQETALENALKDTFDLLNYLSPEEEGGSGEPIEIDKDYLYTYKPLILETFERLGASIGYIFYEGEKDE